MSDKGRAEDILRQKAAGKALSKDDIYYIVKGVYDKELASHQLGAFLMAVYIKGMTPEETAHLTDAMMSFGERLEWNVMGKRQDATDGGWASRVVDKHSTGGVGDKVSIVLAPMVAACGVKVPMISGRGLGITGGTTDKMESFPGYEVEIPKERLNKILEKVGCFIATQSADIAPTDKVIYATRNETGTVASVPLITASIISKKGVEGLRGLVLDVKFGSAAFMKTKEAAEVLALSMTEVGKRLNIKTVALLDRMDCPLGHYVGNGLEIYECIKILQGDLLTSDLMEITYEMGSYMLKLAGIECDLKKGLVQCQEAIKSGKALQVFKEMLVLQGVNRDLVCQLCDKPITELEALRLMNLKVAEVKEVHAPKAGVVKHIEALKVGLFCQSLGATKTHPLDKLDLATGVHLLKKPGDRIEKGEVWVKVYCNKTEGVDWGLLETSIDIGDKFDKIPLIEKVLQ
jgi:pyrimidine-nucleoside phosphorylase